MPEGERRGFAALSVPMFRWFAATSLLSFMNVWMLRIAQDWLVLELTNGSGLQLGFTTFMQLVPGVLLGLWGGVLADRWPKLRVIALSELIVCAAALSVGILHVTGHVRVWHVIVAATVSGVGAALGTPARQATPPEMVPPPLFLGAISTINATQSLARIAGPAVAGLVVSIFGLSTQFVASAVLSLLLAEQLLRMSRVVVLPRAVRAHVDRARGAAAYMATRRDLALVLPVLCICCALGWNSALLIALMARNEFGTGPGGLALLNGLFAVGAVGATIALGVRRAAPSKRTLVHAAVVFGVLSCVAAVMPTFVTFALLLVPVGAASFGSATIFSVAYQLSIPSELRGRMTALYYTTTMGAVPFGALVLGAIADQLGTRWSYFVSGIGIVISVLGGVAFSFAPRLRKVRWLPPAVEQAGAKPSSV
ncbi:MAG: MFS transporter [Ilumatobacteraceae bacterium]